MANKMLALFVMCIVVVAALQGVSAGDTDKENEAYRSCFQTSMDNCMKETGNKYTHCETKCSEDCDKKENQAKLEAVAA